MQFIIQKKHLLKSIQIVSTAISQRTTQPILAGIKIDVTDNNIIITGSSSDITIQSKISKELKLPELDDENSEMIETIITNITPGSIVLPIPHFQEIIKKLPEEEVHIVVDEYFKTTIQSGKAIFTLYGQNAQEYPHIKIQQQEDDMKLQVKDLKQLIRQTVFAVSQMETRPMLTGILITIKDNKITFTGTDSHRLALKTIQLDNDEDNEVRFVIPGKNLHELMKIIDYADEYVYMSLLQNQVLFYTEDTYFLSRLLKGNYPETSRLIPNESDTVIEVYTKQLIQTIERASLLSNKDQNNVIKLETLDDQMIKITGNSPEIGNVEENLATIMIDGEPLKISFSSRYLLDTLKIMDSEIVKITFTGAMRPFIITTTEDPHILQLILPVRTY